jgi:hypothetical protein
MSLQVLCPFLWATGKSPHLLREALLENDTLMICPLSVKGKVVHYPQMRRDPEQNIRIDLHCVTGQLGTHLLALVF